MNYLTISQGISEIESDVNYLNQEQKFQESTKKSIEWIFKQQSNKTKKRGQIREFSRSSRQRLLKQLFKLQHREYLFITLTYQEYEKDYTVWKKHLNHFHQSLKYHYPEFSGVWKLEFQERNAPHFHIIAHFGNEEYENIKSLVKSIWAKVTGQANWVQKKYSTKVQVIKDIKKTQFYLSMYTAKDEKIPEGWKIGRLWGVLGKKNLPCQSYSTIELSNNHYFKIKRIFRKIIC